MMGSLQTSFISPQTWSKSLVSMQTTAGLSPDHVLVPGRRMQICRKGGFDVRIANREDLI
jgi:hypothetical protein